MAVLGHGRPDRDEGVEAARVNEALAVGARHRWVHLGDHPARDAEDSGRQVHRDAGADEAARVRRRDLEHRRVYGQPPAREQRGQLLQQHGHVIEPASGEQGARRGAGRAEIDAVAGLDEGEGLVNGGVLGTGSAITAPALDGARAAGELTRGLAQQARPIWRQEL